MTDTSMNYTKLPAWYFQTGQPAGANTGGLGGGPSTAAPATTMYDTSDPLGEYFQTHQQAGDAWAQLKSTLDQYGLTDLYDFVKNGIVQGWDTAQAYQHLRETPTYKTRFSGNEERVKKGLQPLSEDEYLSNEKAYAQVAKSVGLPPSFYDQPSDFARFIASDISPVEYQDRLVKGYQAATMSDNATKRALQDMYGLSDGELAAYWLDPDATEAILMKQFSAAQIGGAAARTGWGDLNRTQAESLATLGVSNEQAATGFNQLATQHELMQGLVGDSGQRAITPESQLEAAFSNNAMAQQEIKRVAAERVGAFQGSTGFATDKTGTAGIGTAQ
jgi:hypothetical protein